MLTIIRTLNRPATWIRLNGPKRWTSGIFLLCLCSLIADPSYGQTPTPPSTSVQGSAQALEKVIVGMPTVKSLKWYSQQPARLIGIEQTPIYSKLSGYVKKVHVDYGDRVKAGDLLVSLDLPELDDEITIKQADVEKSLAAVEQAKANRTAAQASVDAAKAMVRQAEAGLARTEADIARWKSELTRIESLVQSGSVNRQVLDETQQKFASSRAAQAETMAAVQSQEAATLQMMASVKKADADIVAAETAFHAAEASLKYARTMLAYRELKAPYDGIVTHRDVDTGHFIVAEGGSVRPLITVVKTDVLRAMIAMPEAEAVWVEKDSPVILQVPALRAFEVTGKISRTGWALKDENRVLDTMLELDNRDGKLRPGMFATAKVLLQARENAITLPSAAVVQRDQQTFCYRVIEGKAIKTAIGLGIRVGDDWEITSGLEANATVALNKAATLKDEQAIDATK